MPLLHARNLQVDAEVVVFDKDGTLLDFNHMWGPRTSLWLERLTAQIEHPELMDAFGDALGFDIVHERVMPDGPLAVGTTSDVLTVAAGVLYQNGFRWDEAKALAEHIAAETIAVPPTEGEIKPRGQVLATLQRLSELGFQLAVATNDDRVLTEATLALLGIADLVDAIACGDDPLPAKPDEAVLNWIATQLDSSVARMVMVGDTATDLLTGRNAGVAACIGILDGAGTRETLQLYADALIESIDELTV